MLNTIYAPLHVHTTTGSIGDSVLKIDDYIAKAKRLGLTHIAITDHGSMAAMVEFHEKCKEASIVGIIGMEAYVVKDRVVKDKDEVKSHLVLLAKNKEGVKNLLRIHNDAQLNGFYSKPRTDISMLKKYGKGVIALSACIAGEIPHAILRQDWKEVKRVVKDYQEAFDEFYFEIQPFKDEKQSKVNDILVFLSKKLNIPLVATNDIHYLNNDDYVMHDLHVKSFRKDDTSEDLLYKDTCFYLMEKEEFANSFVTDKYVTKEIIEKAIEQTNKIASKCDGEIEYNFEMPRYLDLPAGETEESYIRKICFKELSKRIQNLINPCEYMERLLYELKVISDLKFCGYFLIVQDFLNYARSHDVAVGPGRGSVGGSLVAWLMGISAADPIQNNLMFERFLSPFRKSLPDVDTDFSNPHIIKDYVIEKYGEEHCALVGTFGNRAAKNSLRAAARLICTSPSEAIKIGDEVCAAIPYKVDDENGEKITNPTIEQMLNCGAMGTKFRKMKEKYPTLFSAALKMQAFPQSMGIHAAGIVISPHSLMDYMPLRRDKKSGRIVSMITKEYIENEALKYDFLGLSTMVSVDKTLKDAKIEVNINDEDFFKDPDVWKIIGSVNTIGLFQIGTNLYRQRMKRLAPKSLQDLAACLALVRGPCISAGTDETYMRIKEGKQNIVKIDPRYDAITAETNGICIYQEQVIHLGKAFGLSSEEADDLRKATSKKKLDKIKALKKIFFEKGAKIGATQKQMTDVFQIIEDSAKYLFNRAHSTTYAMVSYLSAWLKVHYPKEFMSNVLTNAYENGKEAKYINEIISDCRRIGIKFLPVDINKSKWSFMSENEGIRIGFCAIKSFGKRNAENIFHIRPFYSFEDIIKRIELEKEIKYYNSHKEGRKNPKPKLEYEMPDRRKLGALVVAGVFNSFEISKKDILTQIYAAKAQKKGDEVVPDIFSFCKGCDIDWQNDAAIDIEEKIFKTNIIHFPAADLKPSNFESIEIDEQFEAEVHIDKIKKVKDRRGNTMAFLTLSSSDTMFEGVIFGTIYNQLNIKLIHKNAKVKIEAKKNKDDGCIIFSIEQL